MQSQVKKLAVICNVCFWLTIAFKYWKNARDIQADVLNTILILGMAAIAANVAWLVFFFIKRKQVTDKVEKNARAANRYNLLLSIFNTASLLAQIVYLTPGFK